MACHRHLGHIIFDHLRSRPNEIFQLDAATGQSETKISTLSRSVLLAKSLREYGLIPGRDVVALTGRRHLDLVIPFYAALFNGLPLITIDIYSKYDELKRVLEITSPKVVFCESESYDNYERAARDLGLATRVVTFGGGPHSMGTFIQLFPSYQHEEDFKPATVDLDKHYVWLVSTSGSTGSPKVAAYSHRAWLQKMQSHMEIMKAIIIPRRNGTKINGPEPCLVLTSIQWVSSFYRFVDTPLLGYYIVQSSAPITPEHIIELIHNYKPVFMPTGPSTMTYVLKNLASKCDLSSLDVLVTSGAKVYTETMLEFKTKLRPEARVIQWYGATETLGPLIYPDAKTPIGSCGRVYPSKHLLKLVNLDTGEEITEPYVTGELWTFGIHFTCYYNDAEATSKAFTPDGWFKTGDLLYRDEDDNYYFVERIRRLITYQDFNVLPVELEEIIRSHPGVLDAAVTSVPDRFDTEHAVACVVRRPGYNVTAQEIKDLVASKLTKKKHLHGGVIFLDSVPMLYSGKVKLDTLKQIALVSHRE